jgi:iron(III) transport system ATP-binding protein
MDARNQIEQLQEEAGASGPALTLSGVTRQFGSVLALNNVSLDVQAGEIICLVGHSGCGKTSMLRIIAGIDALDGGLLTMGGKVLASPTTFVEPDKRNIGVVFQDYALFPHLSVRDNVLFGLRKMRRDAAQDRMLSGGEQQRVALIRALAPKPHLLLMDEPFSNLDRGLRAKVRRETVSLLRSLGTTAIIVTHEAEEALSTGDRVVLMRAGEIVQSGTARDLHDRPESRYAADFFCDFNVISGALQGSTVETAFGSFKAPKALQSARDVSVYLRPGDLHIVGDDDAVSGDLRCLIETRTFLGETEELVLHADAAPLRLRLRTPIHVPSTVNHVFVRFDRDKALIFHS